MKITPAQNQPVPVEPPSTPSTPSVQAKSQRTSTTSPVANTVEKPEAAIGPTAAAPLQRQTAVTLKRDNNGRVYYSVSDAKSGEEILEVPPKALRDVGQGIEDYIKEQQSKAASHVKVEG
ncbi:MAG TPA: hypothetical protein VGI46_07180 [Candidatus Acidoferrum sp.]|jgi:uncharacterized FlaG/YvyC family protein